MSEELNKEILKELKALNSKLESLNDERNKGLSTFGKFVAIFLGFGLVGPLVSYIMIPLIIKMFN
ncbi:MULTISPECIES: hypothetical protein [unclassified Bacillus (in: firmicutes)]|uniref:hypothetical protein n=1 Tax=unclassified Bacillus (in: firmicutes) TaxID=185979 RepID=UPI000BF08052|nr:MULTISPECIES: hypothetical protein [unclassified Bacillus (in: firmicutes)]PEJ57781.1 hypothetical protein CN692_11880 [Bacillus sp. AFS002410]PEL11968.1 hypothetical protein CN601_09245 [Bacillus sp. AFS017336]